MIKIREVVVEDTEKLQSMLRRLVNEKPPVALELEPLIMKGREWISQFPTGELGYFVVAESEGTIIGFCYLAIPKYYKPVAYIGIVIDKEYRGKDLGSQMFFNVAAWAAEKHLQYIIADVWAWNLKSLKFFEKLGFYEKLRFKDKFRGNEEEKVRLIMKL